MILAEVERLALSATKIRSKESPLYHKEDPQSIQSMFGSIAKSYDRTNAVLSLQMHRWWNNQLIHQVTNRQQPDTLLDLCCGTGEIALSFLKKTPQPKTVYLLDFCPQMLECAKFKSEQASYKKHHLHFLQADAQEIPLPNESISCATIAYGIRNVKDPQRCLMDVFRVLKKGGTFGILELTRPKNRFLRLGHKLYLKTVLPLFGKILASNQEAYDYLQRSITNFVQPEELEHLMNEIGFVQTKRIPLGGGVATIIYGKKP